MNGTVNKILLAGDKFMPKVHLRQPGFIPGYIIQNELKLKDIA